jgi:hypothetical protein
MQVPGGFVTYVSNIYKYYIAYKLVQEKKQAREEENKKIKN